MSDPQESSDCEEQDREDQIPPDETAYYRLLKALDRPEFLRLSCADVIRRLDPGGLRKRGPPASLLDGYVSEKQLAEMLGRTVRTLQIWRQHRSGPPVTKIGTAPFYEVQSVRSWLRAQEQAPLRATRRRRQRSPPNRNERNISS